jgi:hypothetical protein
VSGMFTPERAGCQCEALTCLTWSNLPNPPCFAERGLRDRGSEHHALVIRFHNVRQTAVLSLCSSGPFLGLALVFVRGCLSPRELAIAMVISAVPVGGGAMLIV